jgi:hypothetical protein
MYLDDGVSSASAPAHLPQFSLDQLSGAKSDYRRIHFTQSCSTEQGKKVSPLIVQSEVDVTLSLTSSRTLPKQTRTLKLSLLHAKYGVERVKADVGSVLTLQVWHDVQDKSTASTGTITVTRGKDETEETLACNYDPSLNATTVKVPVDDVLIRNIRFVYDS